MPPALLGGLSTLSCAQEVLRKRLPIICWSLIASLQYPITEMQRQAGECKKGRDYL